MAKKILQQVSFINRSMHLSKCRKSSKSYGLGPLSFGGCAMFVRKFQGDVDRSPVIPEICDEIWS